MRIAEQRRASLAPSKTYAPSRKHTPDYWLLLITVALLAIGLVVVYSISPALAVGKGIEGSALVTRQIIAIIMGLGIFAVVSQIPLKFWRQMALPLMGIALVLTLITLVLPVNAEYPAHRWIRIGSLSFQSVELLKFALIIWAAGFLLSRVEKGQLHDFKATLQPLLITLGVIGFIVADSQSDLGSAVVIMAIVVALVIVSGVRLKVIGVIGLAVLMGGFLLVATSEYRRERIATYMNPSIECSSSAEGYQACQALIAVGSGGMFGLGLGNSVQAYGYLPEAENDSIFAIYAEKFGFVGSAILIGLYGALFARIKRIVDYAADDYTRLVVLGILVWLSIQAFINIMAMIGLIPLKGITLPLMSYGGSSVMMVLAVLGVVFQASRHTHYSMDGDNSQIRREGHENSRHGRRVRGSYHPPLSGRI